MQQVGKWANSEQATTQGMRTWLSSSHLWGFWRFTPRSKFIWQQEWVEKRVNEQQQPQSNSIAALWCFQRCWGFPGKQLGKRRAPCLLCSARNPHPIFMPLTFPHWALCPRVQLCCPVREGLFREALQAHGSERKGTRAVLSKSLDISSSCRALLQEFQWQPEGSEQGCTGMYDLQGNWRQMVPSQLWHPRSSLSSNPQSWEVDWCCSWLWETAGWFVASLQELSHFPFYLSQAHGQGREGREIYLHPTPCSGCNSSPAHARAKPLLRALPWWEGAAGGVAGVLHGRKSQSRDIFLPFSSDCTCSTCLLSLVCSTAETVAKEIPGLISKGTRESASWGKRRFCSASDQLRTCTNPAVREIGSVVFLNTGSWTVNTKPLMDWELLGPAQPPPSSPNYGFHTMSSTARGLQEPGLVSKTVMSTEIPCVKRQLLH